MMKVRYFFYISIYNISSSIINNDKQPSLQNLKYYKELPKITNILGKKTEN